MKPVYVINGPNLNRLGTREPEIYGSTSLSEIEQICRAAADPRPIVFRQSNAEFEIVNWIHQAIDQGAAIVINPAGLSFTSVPIVDALKMFPGPIVELHLSNIHRREEMYRASLVSSVATGVICGLGADGYRIALKAIAHLIEQD